MQGKGKKKGFSSRARYDDPQMDRERRVPASCAVQAHAGVPTGIWDTFGVTMKTQGEIEAAVCEGMSAL